MDKELLNCPFCACKMRLENNRDWHRIRGDHSEYCVFEAVEDAIMVPATDDALAWAVTAWNTRVSAGMPEQHCNHSWQKVNDDEPWLSCENCGKPYTEPVGLQEQAKAETQNKHALYRCTDSECGWTWQAPTPHCSYCAKEMELACADDASPVRQSIQLSDEQREAIEDLLVAADSMAELYNDAAMDKHVEKVRALLSKDSADSSSI